ncbi:MAG TPA: DUF456 domain-containing protein [Anaerolineae bacterium]|nr:DUF456 domain-containing protein [Anaerolineae bacterium]
MVLPGWAFWLAIALFAFGLLGVVMPAVPGVGLIWVVILVYAIAERFATIDVMSFAVLTLLGAAAVTADLWLGQLGAKVAGASFRSTIWGLVGAVAGGLLGLVFGGVGALPGMWVGAVLGVLLSEYREQGSWKAAWQAAVGVAVGSVVSIAVELVIGLTMIAIFVWQVLRG